MPEETRQTTHNKRFGEMAVGVEAAVPPRHCPLVVVQVAERPIRHVRQAAGRYVTFPLVRCEFVGNTLTESYNYQKADYLYTAINCCDL